MIHSVRIAGLWYQQKGMLHISNKSTKTHIFPLNPVARSNLKKRLSGDLTLCNLKWQSLAAEEANQVARFPHAFSRCPQSPRKFPTATSARSVSSPSSCAASPSSPACPSSCGTCASFSSSFPRLHHSRTVTWKGDRRRAQSDGGSVQPDKATDVIWIQESTTANDLSTTAENLPVVKDLLFCNLLIKAQKHHCIHW